MIPTNIKKILIIVFVQLIYGGLKYEVQNLRMMFKTPVKPGWRKRSAAGTMAS